MHSKKEYSVFLHDTKLKEKIPTLKEAYAVRKDLCKKLAVPIEQMEVYDVDGRKVKRYTEAQARATQKYLEKQTKLTIRVSEELKHELYSYARAAGMSLNAYICYCIEQGTGKVNQPFGSDIVQISGFDINYDDVCYLLSLVHVNIQHNNLRKMVLNKTIEVGISKLSNDKYLLYNDTEEVFYFNLRTKKQICKRRGRYLFSMRETGENT